MKEDCVLEVDWILCLMQLLVGEKRNKGDDRHRHDDFDIPAHVIT